MIRTVLVTTLAVLDIMTSVAPAHAETAKEAIERAIEAHGGSANLSKLTAARVTSKSKIFLLGFEIAIDGESTYQLPNLLKNELRTDVMGKKATVVQIYNAGKMRMTVDDAVKPVSDAQKNEFAESLYLQGIQNLVGLLGEKDFELSLLEKADKVGDKEVVGVLVKSKGSKFKDVRLYFDKKTHLLMKMERRGLSFDEKEVEQQMIYLEHKLIDGVLRPVKSEMFMDGKRIMTSESVSYKHLEKVDKKDFDVAD